MKETIESGFETLPDISRVVDGGRDNKVLLVGNTMIPTIPIEEQKVVVVDPTVQKFKRLSLSDSLLAAAILSCGNGWPIPIPRKHYPTEPKKMTKCGLPGCNVLSAKDYCCADHCMEHRKMVKK